mmetsp:Transcript_12175/g.17725  ORF Transcript_12175/g.17725 Transcript_12175/m.17725 type:complete len:147 (+) Transcript_12175:111-551(+)
MKVVIQRVLNGSVHVGQECVGAIGPGLVVLLGISRNDTLEDVQKLARKVLSVRLWSGEKRWSLNVTQKDFEVLVISQFTLYGVLKGNRPDFHMAMQPEQAQELYLQFVEELKKNYFPNKIQTGAFGQYMNIHMTNDGPVTIELQSN